MKLCEVRCERTHLYIPVRWKMLSKMCCFQIILFSFSKFKTSPGTTPCTPSEWWWDLAFNFLSTQLRGYLISSQDRESLQRTTSYVRKKPLSLSVYRLHRWTFICWVQRLLCLSKVHMNLNAKGCLLHDGPWCLFSTPRPLLRNPQGHRRLETTRKCMVSHWPTLKGTALNSMDACPQKNKCPSQAEAFQNFSDKSVAQV